MHIQIFPSKLPTEKSEDNNQTPLSDIPSTSVELESLNTHHYPNINQTQYQDYNNLTVVTKTNLEEKDDILPIEKITTDDLGEVSIEDLGNKNKLFFYSIIKFFNFFRYSSLLCAVLFFLSLMISLIVYYIDKDTIKYKMLLSFHFYSDIYSPFQLNQYAFLLYLFIIILMLTSFSIALIKNDYRFNCPFKEDLAVLFPCTLFLLSLSFIISIFFPVRLFFSKIIVIFLYALALLMLVFIYRKSKSRKNQAIITLVNESFLVSIMLCFVVYVLLFTICEMFIQGQISKDAKKNTTIVFNVFFASISLILLTSYKDIIFTLSLLVIEGGLISFNKNLFARENLIVVIIIIFMVFSLVWTIWKVRKKVFGYDQDGEVIVTEVSQENSN